MRKCLLLLAAAIANLPLALAIYADDAYKLDYHLPLLGHPRRETTFFHRPQASSKASLLYTLSERNVLGAINPKDGSIIWRHSIGADSNATFSHLRAGDGHDVVLSLSESALVAWSAQGGREIWRLDLPDAELKDLEILDIPLSDVSTTRKDALVLTVENQVSVVRRVNGATGDIVWEHKEQSHDTALQVSASTTQVFLITLHSSKLRATSLDFAAGYKTDQFTLGAGAELSTTSNILSVGPNTASPIIAWTDKSMTALHINVIGTKSDTSFSIEQVANSECALSLHAPYHNNAQPHFLVHYQTPTQHWADIYHVDLKTSSVSKVASIPRAPGKGAFATTSLDANVFFTRVTESEIVVYSSSNANQVARWALQDMIIPGLLGSVDPVHVVSELSFKDGEVTAGRCAILLSSGDWILVRDGKLVWHRPEALAHTIAATWVVPSVDKSTIQELEAEAHATVVHAYVHRLQRHLRDLQHLPGFLSSLPARFLTSIGATERPGSAASFGYKQVLICVTDKGRAIALDSMRGSIVWNTALSPAMGILSPPSMTVGDSDTVSLDFHNSSQPMVHIEATTGRQVKKVSPRQHSALQYDFTDEEVVATLAPESSQASVVAWRFRASELERVVDLTYRPLFDPVASPGKVLGDRRVLYKYINPNLIMVCTQRKDLTAFSVHLIDGTTGITLSTSTHQDAKLGLPFAATMSENWFAYSFTAVGSDTRSRGFRLVVGELFESSTPDEGGSSAKANVTHNFKPYLVSQTYTIPEPISLLDITQTNQGITSKSLLAVLARSQALIAIPRMFLEPRRPVDRAPTTNEQLEGLMRYMPVLDFDSRWYLNHQREVMGLRNVTTSPAIVESTSLVFAYGLDIFGTRISPSGSFDVLGKDFNKLQMLATVIALGIATLFVAPLVSCHHAILCSASDSSGSTEADQRALAIMMWVYWDRMCGSQH